MCDYELDDPEFWEEHHDNGFVLVFLPFIAAGIVMLVSLGTLIVYSLSR